MMKNFYAREPALKDRARFITAATQRLSKNSTLSAKAAASRRAPKVSTSLILRRERLDQVGGGLELFLKIARFPFDDVSFSSWPSLDNE